MKHRYIVVEGPIGCGKTSLANRLARKLNASVVLVIEPEAIDWSDLGLIQRAAEDAQEHAIALSAVTADGVAGALAIAAGIPTSTVPAAVPVTLEPIRS